MTGTEIVDGVEYDLATGEMIALDGFDSDEDEERQAEYVLRSMGRTAARRDAARDRRAAIEIQLTEMRNEAVKAIEATPEYVHLAALRYQAERIEAKAGKRLDWLKATYLDFLRMFALPRLVKTRTLETLAGSISLRTPKPGLNVTDPAMAAESLLLLGERDAVRYSILTSGIGKNTKDAIYAGSMNLGGIEVAPEKTTVSVSVGGTKIV